MLIAPIAFVSEHVETLVELDHEYAKLAARGRLRALSAGADAGRARTPSSTSLADAVLEARSDGPAASRRTGLGAARPAMRNARCRHRGDAAA